MFIKYFLFFLSFTLLFTGCSSKNDPKIVYIDKYKEMPIQSASLEHTLNQNYQTQSSTTNLNKHFYSFYNEWRGVKYKFGGNSKSGIDCSALIQKAFNKKLNLNVPRTTKLQAKMGFEIAKSELNTGDLVFFKTGRNSRHVGIYLEDGNFIHASSKKGVIISNLDNNYFKKHYWKSQRIID